MDGAIHWAAGPRLAEAGAAIAPCARGDAKATPGLDLPPPIRHVIHTVGPTWQGGDRGEPEVLASRYRRCLEVAGRSGRVLAGERCGVARLVGRVGPGAPHRTTQGKALVHS